MNQGAPLVSLIMIVKNGMPYLPQALASVHAQTYRNFELVIQDGGSTDSSLAAIAEFKECLSPSESHRVLLDSGPDAGIADAINKAVSRCRGELIGSIDADNLLDSDCQRTFVERFSLHPGAAALYSAQRIIQADGTFSHYFYPPPFNAIDLLDCRLVVPFGSSFFRASLAAGRLYADPNLKTCADFNIWINYLDSEVVMIPDLLVSTRMSGSSMTCRVDTYPQFCRDKIDSVERFFARQEMTPLLRAVKSRSIAGIHLWAAESVLGHSNDCSLASDFITKAREHDPLHPRLQSAVELLDLRNKANETKGLQDGLLRGIWRSARSLF